ncbi:MAG TPA: O-antigen ligase family protein [Bryobacteraceae bacterium]|nr:O-antigen ligase family protein [Bryobacteraceae bacterium]
MSGEPPSGFAPRASGLLLCLFVFSIPWEKSIQVPGIATLSHLLGILTFFAAAVVAARRGSVRPPNLALGLAAVFVLWSALTYFWSMDRQATLSRGVTLAELLAMVWIIWDTCRDSLHQTRLMQSYVWGAVAACASAGFRFFRGEQTYYLRYAAAGFDPNDFGLVLALSIPLALYLALGAGSLMKWCNRAAAVVVLSALLLTGSRAALVAAFVAFGFALWTWGQADPGQRASSALLFFFLLLGLYGFAPVATRQRLATVTTELTRGTLHNRTTIWKAGLRVLRRHPVLGIGAGAYPEAVRPQLGTPGVPGAQYVAHNTFLSVLVECGAIGFAVYALMLGTVAMYVWTLPSAERALWAIMLAVWTVGVSTLTWEHYKPGWLIVGLIMTEWGRPWRTAGLQG